MKKLKPCPFCGKRATLVTYGEGKQGKRFDVRCEHDGCIFVATGMRDTKESAIEAWNRRADYATD